MSVLFTSDLHLGHDLASEKRGFQSVGEHDDFIIQTLKDQCHKNTVLWILGDVVMKGGEIRRLGEILGRKKLVRGNHDELPTLEYMLYFEEIHGITKYKGMWLSHCPIHPQEMYRCTANIHGHIHKNTASPLLDLPYFNVNWDFWSRAVSLEEVKELTVPKEVA